MPLPLASMLGLTLTPPLPAPGHCSLSDGCSFVISLDERDFSMHGPHFLGHVRCNFLGTKFTLHDYGVEEEERAAAVLPRMRRRQFAVVEYKTNILGRVPNSMTLRVPCAPAVRVRVCACVCRRVHARACGSAIVGRTLTCTPIVRVCRRRRLPPSLRAPPCIRPPPTQWACPAMQSLRGNRW